MFTGTYTAIVTPFKNGALDAPALERVIKMQIRGGVDGIVPVGTTGESPTVDYAEHLEIIERTVKLAGDKVKVLAGTGANSTSEAVYLTREAEKIGADGSLQVAPYYNKPTQEGLFQHFRAIARETKLPIVLYSIPGRCGVEIGVETVTGWRTTARTSLASKRPAEAVIACRNCARRWARNSRFLRRRFAYAALHGGGRAMASLAWWPT